MPNIQTSPADFAPQIRDRLRIKNNDFVYACCLPPRSASPSSKFVRASITSPRPIIVGQAVRINVTVLVPNYFTWRARLPALQLPTQSLFYPARLQRTLMKPSPARPMPESA